MRKERGITLIALVITIIVLLILVTVSIQAILGENGISTKAKNAKVQSEIASEKEQINVAYASCKIAKSDSEDDAVTADELEAEMNKSYGAGTVTVTGTERTITVKYGKTNRQYLILQNGVIVDLDEILSNATYGVAIGLAEDGSLVDMSNWNYTFINLDEEYLDGEIWGYELGIQNCGWTEGYKGEIVDGRIEGKVPAYILENSEEYGNDLEEGTFMPVISMAGTFRDETDLIYAPEIPSTVIRLGSTYYSGCFYGCSSLITVPTISENVREMWCTFAYCSALEKAPEIPKGVYNMAACFDGCFSLTGTLRVDANPDNYNSMLEEAAINEGCDLVLTGSSTKLEEMLATKSEDSNIRIGK